MPHALRRNDRTARSITERTSQAVSTSGAEKPAEVTIAFYNVGLNVTQVCNEQFYGERSATQQKGRKRKEFMRNKENTDRNTGAENLQATARASWEEREKAASELGVLDARKMLGQELPTRTSEKSALKQKVWALLRFGVGCTFKHAAHAEYISASSKSAHSERLSQSTRSRVLPQGGSRCA